MTSKAFSYQQERRMFPLLGLGHLSTSLIDTVVQPFG